MNWVSSWMPNTSVFSLTGKSIGVAFKFEDDALF
jgi:hypothetical protein